MRPCGEASRHVGAVEGVGLLNLSSLIGLITVLGNGNSIGWFGPVSCEMRVPQRLAQIEVYWNFILYMTALPSDETAARMAIFGGLCCVVKAVASMPECCFEPG